jgi:hypothetical protein
VLHSKLYLYNLTTALPFFPLPEIIGIGYSPATTTMTIPGRRTAREHIESIRAEKGLRQDGETPPNVADLEKALDV